MFAHKMKNENFANPIKFQLVLTTRLPSGLIRESQMGTSDFHLYSKVRNKQAGTFIIFQMFFQQVWTLFGTVFSSFLKKLLLFG